METKKRLEEKKKELVEDYRHFVHGAMHAQGAMYEESEDAVVEEFQHGLNVLIEELVVKMLEKQEQQISESIEQRFLHQWGKPRPSKEDRFEPAGDCLKCGATIEDFDFGYCPKWFKQIDEDSIEDGELPFN